MVCKGYTDPALTHEAFDEDGYFRTGDVGHLRPDGHVVLTGRLKDIIIRKGENISAKEIEDLLYTHPKVGRRGRGRAARPRAGRAGLRRRRARAGAEPLDLRRDGRPSAEAAGLMTQKIPEQLEVRTDWPRAGTGKIVKKSLRDEYAPA